MERPYQGIIEVSGDSLADSLEDYYRRSAQIPTHLRLVSDRNCCGGILLQQMPGEQSPVADDWRRVGLLAGTLRIHDLADGLAPSLLGRLFAEDDLRVFRPREAQFRCRCSRRRSEDVLKLLGEQDTRDLLAEQGKIEVTCEYCGRTRTFDSIDISQLFTEPPVGTSDTLH